MKIFGGNIESAQHVQTIAFTRPVLGQSEGRVPFSQSGAKPKATIWFTPVFPRLQLFCEFWLVYWWLALSLLAYACFPALGAGYLFCEFWLVYYSVFELDDWPYGCWLTRLFPRLYSASSVRFIALLFCDWPVVSWFFKFDRQSREHRFETVCLFVCSMIAPTERKRT